MVYIKITSNILPSSGGIRLAKRTLGSIKNEYTEASEDQARSENSRLNIARSVGLVDWLSSMRSFDDLQLSTVFGDFQTANRQENTNGTGGL